MIETYMLEQLVAFYECGTLSAAAEQLHLSQPSLSRTMQKLEETFAVPLFERTRNKLTLNENGRLAAEGAKMILSEEAAMVARVRALDRSHRTISVGSVAPGPLFELSPLLSSLYPDQTISTGFSDEETLPISLRQGMQQLIIVRERPEDETIYAHPCGTEHLCASLPASHPLAGRSSLCFEDMDGEDFLMASEVGFWNDLVRREMPHARFHLQGDSASLAAVVASSSMPSFATDVTIRLYHRNNGRVYIPFADGSAVTHYWCCCMKEDRAKYRVLFDALTRLYPKDQPRRQESGD